MAKQENSSEVTRKVRIKYEDMSALYSNQVVINGSAEELFLDFSSGPVPDPVTGESLIPIHTRIALSHAGARRLLSALQQTLKRIDIASQSARPASLPEVK